MRDKNTAEANVPEEFDEGEMFTDEEGAEDEDPGGSGVPTPMAWTLAKMRLARASLVDLVRKRDQETRYPSGEEWKAMGDAALGLGDPPAPPAAAAAATASVPASALPPSPPRGFRMD